MPFIPHTEQDRDEMLAELGLPGGTAGLERLFEEIPANLRVGQAPDLPAALSEMEIGRLMSARAQQDGQPLCFLGAGAYEHHIPAAVWAITTRGEFYSAYTPYQAEASQGTLQLLYEYQSMMTSLTGMEVSNASLYDGASGLGEAVLMAVRLQKKPRAAHIAMSRAVHPHYRSAAIAVAGDQGIVFSELDCGADGRTAATALDAQGVPECSALVIQQPNFFGVLEDVDALTDRAHAQGMLVIAVVNPTSLAILKPPGEWGARGADIVVGEGQPLGVPLASGGPYFGFMTTRMVNVRQMPGRIIGRTLDVDGRPGFTLTLQAREQHIRRAKATSNICTNQGLLVTAATIYLSLLGPEGLARVAEQSRARTATLVARLGELPGVSVVFDAPRFHEAVLRLDRPVAPLLEALARRGIVGGLDLSPYYPELGNALLVCATETRTEADIDAYASTLAALLKEPVR
jgi:glycine dehydrogenase subunit 1